MVRPILLLPVVSFAFQLVVLVIPVPLLATTSSSIASCTEPQIKEWIEKLTKEGDEHKKALEELSKCSDEAALLKNSADVQMLSSAEEVLGQIGTPTVIKSLTSDLNERDDAETRLYAARTLGQIGREAESAVQALITASGYSNPEARIAAIQAVIAIVEDKLNYLEQLQSQQLQFQQLVEIWSLLALEQKLEKLVVPNDALDWPTKTEDLESLSDVHIQIQRQLETRPKVIVLVQNHVQKVEIAIVAGGILIFIFIGYLIFLVLFPGSALRFTISDGCVESTKNIPLVGWCVGCLKWISELAPFKYCPYVLDAWVKKHISKVRQNLSQITKPEIYIHRHELHGNISKKSDFFKPEHYADKFQKKESQYIFVISGDCSTGKTSLAYQIVRWAVWGGTKKGESYQDDEELFKKFCSHRMIPIFMAKNLGGQTLFDYIKLKLEDLVGGVRLDTELVKKLLQKRRILVIVDHSIGMDSATVEKLKNAKNDVSAWVITSRGLEIFDGEIGPTISPWCPVEAENLKLFLEKYIELSPDLTKKQRDNLKNSTEEAVKNLEKIGKAAENQESKGIKIALVALYAEQMVSAAKQGNGEPLPKNIPNLITDYLKRLNDSDTSHFKNEDLRKVAQLTAWECLDNKNAPYTPGSVFIDTVVKKFKDLSLPEEYEKYLEHLGKGSNESRGLSLIQKEESSQGEFLSFESGFFAEYLAGLHLLREYGSDKDKWSGFLEKVKQNSTFINSAFINKKFNPPIAVQSFFQALCNCCDSNYCHDFLNGRTPPKDVRDELEKFATWDSELFEKLKQESDERQLKLTKEKLKPGASFDLDLGAIGSLEYKPRNKDNEPKNKLLSLLMKLSVSPSQTASLAESQAIEKPNTIAADELSKRASRILEACWDFGGKVGEKVLQQAWQELENKLLLVLENTRVRLIKPPGGFTPFLPNDIPLEMVKIPEGTFQMGSSNTEPHSISNECPQHQVSVKSFFMGKYPITQAQWKAVMGPSSNPSEFKEDNSPVESVSWEDATEFCNRLNRLPEIKGSGYRLPSEAEWEYACRAGTKAPYHFGDTLIMKMKPANFDDFIGQTTPVGLYRFANLFGLYDMHGNVCEWCADNWHKTYANAPTDGSAWITEGDDCYRVLRGGSWRSKANECRSAYRNSNGPGINSAIIGFRVVCDRL